MANCFPPRRMRADNMLPPVFFFGAGVDGDAEVDGEDGAGA